MPMYGHVTQGYEVSAEGYGLSPNVADLEGRIKNCIKIELVCYGGTCLYFILWFQTCDKTKSLQI